MPKTDAVTSPARQKKFHPTLRISRSNPVPSNSVIIFQPGTKASLLNSRFFGSDIFALITIAPALMSCVIEDSLVRAYKLDPVSFWASQMPPKTDQIQPSDHLVTNHIGHDRIKNPRTTTHRKSIRNRHGRPQSSC